MSPCPCHPLRPQWNRPCYDGVGPHPDIRRIFQELRLHVVSVHEPAQEVQRRADHWSASIPPGMALMQVTS